MKLTSMERTAADKKTAKKAHEIYPSSGEDYPYGLCLRLGKDELSKLGITDLPEAGAEMKLEAKVKVISVSESASERNESRNVELQVTSMALEQDKALDAEDMAGYAKRRGKVR